jgi:hypothetical protein
MGTCQALSVYRSPRWLTEPRVVVCKTGRRSTRAAVELLAAGRRCSNSDAPKTIMFVKAERHLRCLAHRGPEECSLSTHCRGRSISPGFPPMG